ncbi:hypothetical protein HK101_011123 [Irineochytrium annulatum]|nr:hypothetical protein HK101_011123 [Irineochytrium annulatum]
MKSARRSKSQWGLSSSLSPDPAPSQEKAVRYDYIVIGVGGAGCAVVSELVASNRVGAVLALERGCGTAEAPLTHNVRSWGPNLATDAVKWTRTKSGSWAGQGALPFFSLFISAHRHSFAGNVVGGSTAVNGGIYLEEADDQISRVFAGTGITAAMASSASRAVRDRLNVDKVSRVATSSVIHEIMMRSETGPFHGDSYQTKPGVLHCYRTYDDDGRRRCASEFLPREGEPGFEKLHLRTRTIVTRILFGDDRRAIGVETRSVDPRNRNRLLPSPPTLFFLKDGGEIILSAGALDTPRVLQLSGIGAASLLDPLGIPVLVDNIHVGQHLKDHTVLPVSIPVLTPVDFTLLDCQAFSPKFAIEIFTGGGIASSANCATLGALRTQYRMPIVKRLLRVATDVPKSPLKKITDQQIGFALTVNVPTSEGSVEIKGVGPLEGMVVRGPGIETEEDLDTIREAVMTLRKMLASKEFTDRGRHRILFFTKAGEWEERDGDDKAPPCDKKDAMDVSLNADFVLPALPRYPTLRTPFSDVNPEKEPSDPDAIEEPHQPTTTVSSTFSSTASTLVPTSPSPAKNPPWTRPPFAVLPYLPPDSLLSSRDSMRRWLRRAAVDGFHYTSTARLGDVLDEEFRVKGVAGVRVIDASAMRDVPEGNPQATVMMMGKVVGRAVARGCRVEEVMF